MHIGSRKPTLTNLSELVTRYKSDPESVYNTWFISNEMRMKAFRPIRRGVLEVIDVHQRRDLRE